MSREEYVLKKAEMGDSVRVHYTGTLSDGQVFDSSLEREPLAFTVGAGQMILGFDAGVRGMAEGESKRIEISADQAYGPFRDELVMEVGIDQFPPEANPQVGMRYRFETQDGHALVLTVTGVGERTVVLDGNHELAGEDLIFDVTMVSIEKGA